MARVSETSSAETASDEETLPAADAVRKADVEDDPAKGSDPRLDAAMLEAAKSRERYRLLFEQSPVGVLTFDRDLRITDVNLRMEEILQSDRDRLVGLEMETLEDRRVLPAIRAALEGRRGAYDGRYDATTSDARIWVSVRSVPLRDPSGDEITGGICIIEDVSERREVEEVQAAIYEISEAVHDTEDLESLYRRIHGVIARLVPVENFYLAIWDPSTEIIHFPYFVDREDEPPPPQKAGTGLTEHVLRSGEPLLMTHDEIRERIDSGDFQARGHLPAFWLGVPLRTHESTIGAMALQSYDESVRIEARHRRMLGFVAGQIALAIERKNHEKQIERMAFFDGLTNLYNRRMLQEQAERILAMAERHGWQLALLYLDLDRFKNINDTLGHDAGDDLLAAIAGQLRAVLRRSDTLARLGGDEFAVLLTQSSQVEAARTARRLLEALDRPFDLRGRRVHIGASLGIALYPQHGDDLEALLKHADIAMYRAKSKGGGFTFFTPEESPYSVRRLDLEAQLRQAVQDGTLELFYQPIVVVGSGRVRAVEALARWYDADGQAIPAAEFIPLAEESDLIRQIDYWVLNQVLVDSARWQQVEPTLQLAVNISARSLHHRDLVDRVEAELAASGVDPGRLVLEITESSAIRDPETAARVLRDLRRLGVSIALDDFGAGYASITQLRQLPCDRVKIDRGLIAEIGEEGRGEKLLLAAIRLGQGLGLEVVAEGVEEPHQLQWLRQRGCDLAQGWHLGRPIPLERLLEEFEKPR